MSGRKGIGPQDQALLQCRLRLKDDVRFVPQPDSGGTDYVVTRENDQRFFACNPFTYRFLVSLDGHDTLENKLKALPEHPGEEILFGLLNQLAQLGYFDGIAGEHQKAAWWQRFKRPVAMKFELFNPTQLLEWLSGLGKVIFSPSALLPYLLLLLFSGMQLTTQWQELEQHWQSRFSDPLNLVLLPLVFILLKACHELGHGLAVKHFGGQIRECGIFLIAFIPLPYVDASACYSFSRRQRIVVGLAGMQVELLLAMLAFWGWCQLTPGVLSDLLFDLAFIGSVSTLLFNLNPLMKFDGYYVLSDLLGIINLDPRSRAMLSHRLKRVLLGLSSDATHGAQSPWLMLYAILAIPYRIIISLSIALYLSSQFFVFGLLLAIWVLLQQLAWPMLRGLARLFVQAHRQQRTGRYLAVIGASGLFIYVTFFVAAFGASDTQFAIVVPAPSQQVRASAEGVVETLYIDNHTLVKQGQPIAKLHDPMLALEVEKQTQWIRELKARHQGLEQRQVHQAQVLMDKIQVARQELDVLVNKVAQLTVVAPADGLVVLVREQDLPGSFVQRGEIIAHLKHPTNLKLVSVVGAEQIERVGYRLASVEVMFHGLPGQVFRGEIGKSIPAAKSELPSRFLGSQLGGDVLVDGRDNSGKRTLERIFITEVQVQGIFDSFVPAKAKVRFNYQKQTLARQINDLIVRGLLAKLNWHFSH